MLLATVSKCVVTAIFVAITNTAFHSSGDVTATTIAKMAVMNYTVGNAQILRRHSNVEIRVASTKIEFVILIMIVEMVLMNCIVESRF